MDMVNYTRFFVAFIFVIGLMYALSWLARRYLPGAIPLTENNRKKRLHIVEMTPLDTKRRLALIKRDDVEHLVILGPNSETVIETNIKAALDAKATKKNNKRATKV